MSSLRDQLSGLVYSTESGRQCPDCGEPQSQCRCDELDEQARIASLDGVVRIRRETSGRKGKGVTTIQGIPLTEPDLKMLAKKLKQRCGTGGSVKDGIIEIQGDHRVTLKEALESEGYTVKLSGG